MTSNVIPLPEKCRVLTCHTCGDCEWYLCDDGVIRCVGCEKAAEGLLWGVEETDAEG